MVMRSNGQPVYNFCVTVDDATMAISHVIRLVQQRDMLLIFWFILVYNITAGICIPEQKSTCQIL